MLGKLTLLSLVVVGVVNGQLEPNITGNCISGPLKYSPKRIFDISGHKSNPWDKEIDVSKVDFLAEYGLQQNIHPFGDGGFSISIARNTEPGGKNLAAVMSTSRYLKYGKFSVRMKAAPSPGLVTTFISMSDVGDEIDWEVTGKNQNPQTNIFYRIAPNFTDTQKERGYHGDGPNQLPRTNYQSSLYEIDWKRDSITFRRDGVPVRTINRTIERSHNFPTQPWFPDTPSKIQFSVWDGKESPDWTGSPIEWTSPKLTAEFTDLTIQCYDDLDNEVPKWPAGPENPDHVDGDAPQKSTVPVITPPKAPEGRLPGTPDSAISSFSSVLLIFASLLAGLV